MNRGGIMRLPRGEIQAPMAPGRDHGGERGPVPFHQMSWDHAGWRWLRDWMAENWSDHPWGTR